MMNSWGRPYAITTDNSDPRSYQQNMMQSSSNHWEMPMYQQNRMQSNSNNWNAPIYEQNTEYRNSQWNAETYQQNTIQSASDWDRPMDQNDYNDCNDYYEEGPYSAPRGQQRFLDNGAECNDYYAENSYSASRGQHRTFDNGADSHQNIPPPRIKSLSKAKKRKARLQLEMEAKSYFEGQSDYNPFKWYKNNSQSLGKKGKGLMPAATDENMLKFGVKPSAKMVSFLESIFGHVFKDIKVLMDEDKKGFISTQVKKVKNIIRSRVYDLVLDKPAPVYAEIVKEYRIMFPETADVEFMKMIKTPKVLTKEETLNRMVGSKVRIQLDRIFPKLAGDNRKSETAESNLDKSTATIDKVDDAGKKSDVEENIEEGKENTEEVQDNTNINSENVTNNIENEKISKLEEKRDNMTDIDEELVNRVILESLPFILKKEGVSIAKTMILKDEIMKELIKRGKQPFPSPAVNHSKHKYFVKLIGHPYLPKKLKQYLKKFNPRSVKKHRSIHNLMFIRLRNQDALNAICADNGAKVGKSKLTITRSRRSALDFKEFYERPSTTDHTLKLDEYESDEYFSDTEITRSPASAKSGESTDDDTAENAHEINDAWSVAAGVAVEEGKE